MLKSANAPVLVEASHYRFHPAWSTFLSLFDPSKIVEAHSHTGIPAGLFPLDDIRFQYDLAGGALMDVGHYSLSALRGVFGTDPTSVTSATARVMPQGFDTRCEEGMHASYTFPNGGVGIVEADLSRRGGYWFPWLTSNWPSVRPLVPWIRVKLKEEESAGQNGGKIITQRTLTFWNFMGPHAWHRIDITTTTSSRKVAGKVVKQGAKTEYKKVYKWPQEAGKTVEGEDWWSTYRYMLEEFVNKVKKREGSGMWVDGEESIRQMEVTDKTYEKAGLMLRPTSEGLEM